jgi:hypothetical protein
VAGKSEKLRGEGEGKEMFYKGNFLSYYIMIQKIFPIGNIPKTLPE